MSSTFRTLWRRNDQRNDSQEDNLVEQQGSSEVDATTNDSTPEGGDQQLNLGGGTPTKPVYTSQWATLLIIVNVTIGVGLLAMPFEINTAGVVSSMLIQLVFLVLVVITCIMCIELTVKSEVNSYHEIVKVHCHPIFYQFTQASILLICFGAAVAYIVTIGDQSDRVLASKYGSNFCQTWYMNRRFIMSAVTLVAIKPLCSARTVDFLKYASFLGIVSIGFIFYVVLSGFLKLDHLPSDINYYPKSWSDVISILPVFCLSYQCHLSLVPIVASVKRHEKPKAFRTSTIAMIFSAIIYTVISLLAVLTYGSAIQSDLTESFRDKNATTLITIAVVGLKCVLTLPAAFLPARLSLVDILTNNCQMFANLSEPVRRVSITLIFLDAALLLALCVPNIVVAVNILGCLAVMFIFTLPGIAYLNLIKQNRLEKQQSSGVNDVELVYTGKDKMKRFISFFMIIFGVLMTIVVLFKSVLEMTNSTPVQPLCHN